jgi:hypothetical protein
MTRLVALALLALACACTALPPGECSPGASLECRGLNPG